MDDWSGSVQRFEIGGVYECHLERDGTLARRLIRVIDRVDGVIFYVPLRDEAFVSTAPVSSRDVRDFETVQESITTPIGGSGGGRRRGGRRRAGRRGGRDLRNAIFIKATFTYKYNAILFCAIKLIALAHRAKERMYFPGGSGFMAAKAKFESSQAENWMTPQRIEVLD